MSLYFRILKKICVAQHDELSRFPSRSKGRLPVNIGKVIPQITAQLEETIKQLINSRCREAFVSPVIADTLRLHVQNAQNFMLNLRGEMRLIECVEERPLAPSSE